MNKSYIKAASENDCVLSAQFVRMIDKETKAARSASFEVTDDGELKPRVEHAIESAWHPVDRCSEETLDFNNVIMNVTEKVVNK